MGMEALCQTVTNLLQRSDLYGKSAVVADFEVLKRSLRMESAYLSRSLE